MGSLVLNDGMASSASAPAFPRQGGVLHAEQVPIPAIAAAVGTPTYVYCANAIRMRYEQLTQAFAGVPHRIHFAMKANSNLAVLRLLHDMGAGVDIVSGGELYRAHEAGFPGRAVVFSGVGKTVREIEQALEARVLLINVESEAELVTIDAVAGRQGVVAPIAIRVNPEVTVGSPHAYIKTGEKGQKFGIPTERRGLKYKDESRRYLGICWAAENPRTQPTILASSARLPKHLTFYKRSSLYVRNTLAPWRSVTV